MKVLSRFAGFLAGHWPVLALVAVLTLSAIIISPKKPFWNDELFSWYFMTADFGTLWRGYNDALNNTPFFYFGLGWLWVQVFGGSELSLRLFSSLGLSLAALALWPLLRRVHGFWPATFALLGTFCTSVLVLEQNAEARMYGLFLALIVLAVVLYDRLVRAGRPAPTLLVLNVLVHAAIVQTHLFGPFYSGTIAAAFLASRLSEPGTGWRRLLAPWPVHLSFVIAWLSFLLYLPAFQAQAEAGRPYSWIPQPTLGDLAVLLSNASGALLRPEIFVLVVGAAALLWLLMPAHDRAATGPGPLRLDDRHLLLLALALLALPVVIWLASHLGRPIFFDRYLMPSLLGWAVLIAHAAARLLPDPAPSGQRLRLARGLVLGLPALALLAYPVLDARAYSGRSVPGSIEPWPEYSHLPVVMQGGGLLEYVHYAPDPARYHFILDWEATNRPESGRFGIQEHRHMEAWQRVFPEVFGSRIVESEPFLARHDVFLVSTIEEYESACSPNIRGLRHVRNWTGLHCPQWVARRILPDPALEVTEISSGGGYALLHVRRKATPSHAP